MKTIMNLRTVLVLLLSFVTTLTVFSQRREVHILSANDMHATLGLMPQLGGIADSLRALYPSLLVLSAGDNRTGNPLNDMYSPSGYPMVTLMNQIGFNASALGNHEFDMGSLPHTIDHSNFRYLCANIHADDTTGIRTVPYQIFDVEGVKVGIIGVVQVGVLGRPDTHPDNLHGITFEKPAEVVGRYESLRNSCDVVMLLSHAGYEVDTLMANRYGWLDLIVGGHTHIQLSADEPLHNGVLLTHNNNKLQQNVTHITLTVDSGRVVEKHAEYIDVKSFQSKNAIVDVMVNYYSNNPDYQRVLAKATTPLETKREIGSLFCDALMSETDTDFAIANYNGVRLSRMPAGDITVGNVLELDPFGNTAVIINMKGSQILEFLQKYSRMETYRFPHLGGFMAELTLDKENSTVIKNIKLTTMDGKCLNLKKTYRVVTNSYIAAFCRESLGITDMETVNRYTADMLIHFLTQRESVDYQGVNRITFK